jgi:Family of unknown function (DUF5670)
MLFIIAGVLVVCWFGGLFFKVAGGFIHLFLVLALIMIVISFFSGHAGSP